MDRRSRRPYANFRPKLQSASAAEIVKDITIRMAHPNLLVKRHQPRGPGRVLPTLGCGSSRLDDSGLEVRHPIYWVTAVTGVDERGIGEVKRAAACDRRAPGPGRHQVSEPRRRELHPRVNPLFKEEVGTGIARRQTSGGARDRASNGVLGVWPLGCHVGVFPAT